MVLIAEEGPPGKPFALTVLCAYLGLTAVPVVLAAGRAPLVTLAHVAALAATVSLLRRPRTTWLEEWLPLLAIPFLYEELPALIAATGGSYHDALVQRWETSLFGTSPVITLSRRFGWTALSELVHAGYLSFYAVIYLPPLALYFRGDRRAFRATVSALLVTYALCFAVFIVFPVQGPRYVWPAPPGVPDGPIRRATLGILGAGSSRGAAFPSSHMAVAVAQAMMATAFTRRRSVVLWTAAALIGFGAVYGGFHYAVDILAGAALGALVAACVLAVTEGGTV